MKPTVGRIVHYWPKFGTWEAPQEEPWPAIVLEVGDGDSILLRVFSVRGASNDLTVAAKQVLSPAPPNAGPNWRAGCWDWPMMVGEVTEFDPEQIKEAVSRRNYP
jgi:hypothetical protein